jgi:hypothetical protein
MTREDEASNPEPLGKEGDTCAQCGTALAVDQRYCLTCGTPRGEPRLDYQRHLSAGGAGVRGAGPGGAGPGGGVQWSPLFVVLAIAALGVMLLLGVLIGKDDNEVTVTEVPASTTTTTTAPATTTAPTTTTTPTTPPPTEGTTTVPPDDAGSGDGAQRQDGSGGLAPGGTD